MLQDERNINIILNFFLDNLKLNAGTTNNLKKFRDIVTTFSKDIDMKVRVDKCAYIKINAGKQTNSKVPLEMSSLFQPVANGDTCKYLGQDENIAYVGEVTKKEYQKNYTLGAEKYGLQNSLYTIKQLLITYL